MTIRIAMKRTLNIPVIESAMQNAGMNAAGLARALDVSREAVSRWLKSGSVPRPDKQLKLALTLGLGLHDLLVMDSANDPVIAFRKKGARKTTERHIEHAKMIGRLLRPLVEYLPSDRSRGPRTLKEPLLNNYEYLQALAQDIRGSIGIGAEEPLDFRDLINLFKGQQTVLIPVLWGAKDRHENALHIYLPDSQSTWVFLNLDVAVHDFKFWMAHEYAHVCSPHLTGNDGEDFADSLAGALLFPESIAEDAYNRIKRARNPGTRMNRIKGVAEQHLISPVSVHHEMLSYARHHQLEPIDMGDSIYGAARNLTGKYYQVSASLFKQQPPSPEHYVEISEGLFQSPFFKALRNYLTDQNKGPGYLQTILDSSLLDAKSLHDVLT